jgi:protein tyrosine/serine phosphatase
VEDREDGATPRAATGAGDAPDRRVALDGAFNCRDLGGLRTQSGGRVRTGRVFRSDALHHLAPADIAHLRDARGLRLVVDLRSSWERAAEAPAALCAPPIELQHVPIFERDRASEAPPEARLADLYFGLMQLARAPIARVVTLIAECRVPALFHCAAGKDRTGIIAAALLGALDVVDEDVIDDYAETRRSLDRIHARLRESEGYQYVFTELPPETLHAEPETMAGLLARVRAAHGSMEGYLRASGVTAETLGQLRARLLGDA